MSDVEKGRYSPGAVILGAIALIVVFGGGMWYIADPNIPPISIFTDQQSSVRAADQQLSSTSCRQWINDEGAIQQEQEATVLLNTLRPTAADPDLADQFASKLIALCRKGPAYTVVELGERIYDHEPMYAR